MKELFEKQLNRNKPLTQDVLSKWENKKYFNGDENQVGDIVLMAFLKEKIILEEGECKEVHLKVIKLCERHFDLFEYEDDFITSNGMPIVKLKQNN